MHLHRLANMTYTWKLKMLILHKLWCIIISDFIINCFILQNIVDDNSKFFNWSLRIIMNNFCFMLHFMQFMLFLLLLLLHSWYIHAGGTHEFWEGKVTLQKHHFNSFTEKRIAKMKCRSDEHQLIVL